MATPYKVKLQKSYFPSVKDVELWRHAVGDQLRCASLKNPNNIALVEIKEDGSISRKWSYKDLYNASLSIAKILSSKYNKGDRIAVWSSNNPEWVLLEFAAALAGLVLVTVNPSYQAPELEYILKQSQCKTIFLCKSFRTNPMWDIAYSVCKSLNSQIELINIKDIQNLSTDDLEQENLPKVLPQDPFQIQYTSGTTGLPKGALLTHKGLLNNARFCQERTGMKLGDKFLNTMPLFHCASSGMATLGCLTHGAIHYLMPSFDPLLVGKIIDEEKIDYWGGVPTMFVETMRSRENSTRDFSSLKGCTSGGATVAPALIKEVKFRLGVDLQVVYGQTEASPLISMAWRSDPADEFNETVGQPLPHTEVTILDLDNDEICDVRVIGEICCRGYNVMSMYFNDTSATSDAITEKGWLRTGDLGFMDECGYLSITGRTKEMIIRGGENIYPKEIENHMLKNSLISEVAVVGVPDKILGEIVVCFLKFDGSSILTADQLKNFVRKNLSPQKTPKHWIKISDWPLTGSGKIKKFVLKEKYMRGDFEKEKL